MSTKSTRQGLTAVVVLGFVLTLFGCSKGAATAPTPVPSASPPATAALSTGTIHPTPTASVGCPVAPDICTFGTTVAAAVEAAAFGDLVANAQAHEYTCPGTIAQGLGGPFPLCEGVTSGERRPGYPIAYLASEGVVVNVDGLKDALVQWTKSANTSDSDAFGTGANRLFTVGCQTGGSAPCVSQFALVFSQLRPSTPTRIELILYFERVATGPQLDFLVIGPLLDGEQQRAALQGGSPPAFFGPQGWSPTITFYPLPR